MLAFAPPAVDSPLVIMNDGPLISATSYWDTPLAARGGLFASFNAGACRLLVPNHARGFQIHDLLQAADAAREVLVAVVRRPEDHRMALELLWEDDSDTPFVVHLGAQQMDRLPPAADHGRTIAVSVWQRGFGGQPTCVLTQPGRLRVVSRVPYLRPWGR